MQDAVADIEVLTAEECRSARNTIHELRQHWLRRNLWVPFFTLGAASYIDAAVDTPNYYAMARQYNPLLLEHFSWLYERSCAVLAERLGQPVTLADNLALPGFHIYLSSKVFEKPVASVHCDSQYSFHDWSGTDTDLSRPISFTLSVALPENGGGLNVWDVRLDDIAGKSPEETKALMDVRGMSYHAYGVGRMAVHSGHVLHQAAPGTDVQPEDERITLQGHAIFSNRAWRIYW